MSNIKKYIIDYDWKASIEIEIDHDVSRTVQ
ncbi:single stranded DNA-binding protein [Escherichia coli]|nr:single stranded DNA-binding protein [Escherichia coli]